MHDTVAIMREALERTKVRAQVHGEKRSCASSWWSSLLGFSILCAACAGQTGITVRSAGRMWRRKAQDEGCTDLSLSCSQQP